MKAVPLECVADLFRAVELVNFGWTEVFFFNPPDDDYITRAQLWCWTEVGDDNWEFLARRFYFKDPKDAMIFKLRWS